MECQHFENGTCKLVNAIVGKPAMILKEICTKCGNEPEPQQLNRVVQAWADFSKRKQPGVPPSNEGPGTELKKLLSWFHSPDKRKCKCQTRIQKMNAWGPDKCEQKMETILRWMRHSSKFHKIPFFEPAVRLVIRTATRRSRSLLRQHPEQIARSPIVLHPLKPVDGHR